MGQGPPHDFNPGVEAPIPRGSNATKSNRALTAGDIRSAIASSDSVLDPPGPPASQNIEPMRSSAVPVAGIRAIAIRTSPPPRLP